VAFLHVVAWLIAVVYSTIPSFWLVVHPRARKLGQFDKPLVGAGAIWFVMWIGMGLITWPFLHVLLYRTVWSWIPAGILFTAGMVVYALGTRRFTTDQLLGRTELHPQKHKQHLVTTGIRRYVRHPIYLGHFLELAAWSIGTGMAVIYGMTAFAVVTGLIMVRAEDRELEQRFGHEYRQYQAQVPALIPRLRRP